MKAQVKRYKGILKIEIDGKLYDPLSFKSFRPNPQNISEFYDAGVRIFSVLSSGITSALGVPYSLFGESWIGENKYDFSTIDKQMDMFNANAPEAYFAPMIQLDTREWYLESHENIPNSFTHLSQIAHDEEWKYAAANYLKAVIVHCEKKYGDKTYGYFLLCGTTTEWFSGFDYEEIHPIKNNAYKKWRNDKDINLPSLERLNQNGKVFLDKDEDDVYMARKFHAETIANLILYFTKEAQSVLHHNKLLGLYYGYLLELSKERVYNFGSLAYEKVFLSSDIDMISSPSSYLYRDISDPSAFMVTQKTLDAHNKLYFLEFDHITHVAPKEILEGYDNSRNKRLTKIPGADNKCKNEFETLNLMYRDFILCNGSMTALWWFDMFDGWFRSDGMMSAVENMLRITKELSKEETESVAEIAVFAEGESMYHVRKSADINTLCLSDIRRTLAECGAAYDFYSVSDVMLPEMDKYKLYIFLNQYYISEELKSYIDEKVINSGKAILWLYAPGFINGGMEEISSITRMSVASSNESHGRLTFGSEKMSYEVEAPYFCINEPSVCPIAHFEDGRTAIAYKEINGYKSMYASTCNIPSEVLREIAKIANVHIFSDDKRVYVYPNSSSTGVYNASGRDCQIQLANDGIYVDLLSNEKYECKDGVLFLPQKMINAFLLKKEI